MTKFIHIVGSPIPFVLCLLLITLSSMKGWVSSGGFFVALGVLTVLGVSSALISQRKRKDDHG